MNVSELRYNNFNAACFTYKPFDCQFDSRGNTKNRCMLLLGKKKTEKRERKRKKNERRSCENEGEFDQ